MSTRSSINIIGLNKIYKSIVLNLKSINLWSFRPHDYPSKDTEISFCFTIAHKQQQNT